jgi:hypothetical protein
VIALFWSELDVRRNCGGKILGISPIFEFELYLQGVRNQEIWVRKPPLYPTELRAQSCCK